MKKLAIITTHPIQYHSPWFKMLTERRFVKLKVFYTWGQLAKDAKFDPDFGQFVKWDISLTEGYDFSFIRNIAKRPGSHHYTGIDNPSLITEVEKWEPDAILVFGWKFKSHLRILRHFKGKKKILFRGDSSLLDEDGHFLKTTARQVFLKWVYQHVDGCLYVGHANKEYFLKMGLKQEQLMFVPHAVDNDRFSYGNGNYRVHFEIPENAPVVIFAGKLEEKKNPLLLLEAFFAAHITSAHLLLVGEGKMTGLLKQRVLQLPASVQKRIHLTGFVNQSVMPSLYHCSDIFVLPSQGPGETWGLSVNEAMAAGCALIISNKCGCYPDLVEDGVNGFVFESGNVDQLTSLLERMLVDKNYLKKMGDASKERIRNYSFEAICTAIENISF